MRARHFTAGYLLNPEHPVTVNLVGCGGTGSQVLTGLAKLNQALRVLEHPGIHVTAFDPDFVSEANIGRQAFSPSDIGAPKTSTLVERINRFYGFDWKAENRHYGGPHEKSQANILLTCVDSALTRVMISEMAMVALVGDRPYKKPYYWMDFGNSRTTGQVILGTFGHIVQPKSDEPLQGKLQTVTEMFPDLMAHDNEKEQGPSCSFAEAIQKQDLYINSTLAQFGCNLLWKLFREANVSYQGAFINMDLLHTTAIPIFAEEHKPMKRKPTLKKK